MREVSLSHNVELHSRHSLSIVIQAIESRRMEQARGVWHVWGREEVQAAFYLGNLREIDHLEDPDVGGKIILKWIFKN